jgi:hypothetical protein
MIKQAALEAISIRHRGHTRNYVAVLSVDQRGLETPVQWSQMMCEEPVWAQMIRAGWLVTVEMTFTDGARVSLDAVCP